MDIERHLISKVVLEEDVIPAIEARITPAFFEDRESRTVWGWILEYWNSYAAAPTEKALKRNYPAYKLVTVDEPMDFYLDEMRDEYKRRLTHDTFTQAVTALEKGDVDQALNFAAQGISRIGTEVAVLRDSDLTKTWEQRVRRYQMLEKFRGQLRGVPTGFPTLDEALSGLQPEQLITVIGEPKAGKSTLLMRMALAAADAGKSVLFLSFEMSAEEQEARHDAMRAHLDHRKMLAGRMTETEKVRLPRTLKRQADRPAFILSTDVSSATTVSGVGAKIDQYKPDIVFVDGVYLMDDEHGADKGTPQALTNLTRSFKRLAQRSRIPIVGSTQVLTWKFSRKQGLTADAIGYSSSFAQDSDVILGVESTPAEEIKQVSIVLARAAPRRQIPVHWDWQTASFEEMTEDSEDEDDE